MGFPIGSRRGPDLRPLRPDLRRDHRCHRMDPRPRRLSETVAGAVPTRYHGTIRWLVVYQWYTYYCGE